MPDSQIKVTLDDHMGSDLKVVNAARVSFKKRSTWERKPVYEFYGEDDYVGRAWERVLSERDAKLVNYLGKHEHEAPFGHCFATFIVEAPIFVARQLVKHEYLRMSEISRRYVDDDPEFFTPDVWRARASNKKQGSSDEAINLHACNIVGWDFLDYTAAQVVEEHRQNTMAIYKGLLAAGVAPEQARQLLPVETMTMWYWSGSLDAFFNMYRLRSKEDTQYETRLVANQIGEYLSTLFPVAWKALNSEEA